MTITYFQNHGVTITYDERLRLGVAEWNGFLNGHEFKEAVTACLQLIKEHKPLRWLGDNRKMKAIRQADQEWFAKEALPVIYHSSVTHYATVMSEDFFNKAAIEQMFRHAPDLGDMASKSFDNRPAALQWLSDVTYAPSQEQHG